MNYPNGAIFISLEPRSSKMKDAIEFIIKRNRGWGFQEANLTYDLPLDFLVLPCSWFDPTWIKYPSTIKDIFSTVKEEYKFDTFLKVVFVIIGIINGIDKLITTLLFYNYLKLFVNNMQF